MAGVERVSVHVSRLAHCPDVFFVEFSRAGSVGNLVVPLDRSEAEALRDELGEALSGRITEAPDIPFMTFNLQPEVSRAVSEA